MSALPDPPPSDDDLLSPAQVARDTGMSVNTIKRWIADGTLTGVRLGPRVLRVRRGDLRAIERPARPTTGVAFPRRFTEADLTPEQRDVILNVLRPVYRQMIAEQTTTGGFA